MNAIRALHRGPNRISSVEAVTDNVFANMKKEAGHLPAGNSPSDPPPNKPGGRKRLDYNADDDDDWNYYYLGTKQSLGAKAGLTSLQFHIDNCHVGYHPDCSHCNASKSNKRRIRLQVDPFVPSLPGQIWYMDTVTFPVRSLQGSKYMIVMRCPAVKFLIGIPLVFRSESVIAIEQTIKAMRADPVFKQHGYAMFEYIYMDIAGEWSPDAIQWTDMCTRNGIHPTWKSPETKSGAIEKSVGIVEEHINATMFSQNLPQEWWERIAIMAIWHLNRFPTSCAAIDGDVASPIELLSNGRYSRRQVHKELKASGPPGMLALVYDNNVKGSDLDARQRPGVLIGMTGSIPIWEDPFTHSHFRCKSYTKVNVAEGLNFYQL